MTAAGQQLERRALGAQKGRKTMKLSGNYGKRFSVECEDKHVRPYSWTRFTHDIDNFERLGLITTNNAERADLDDDYIIHVEAHAIYDEDFQRFMRCVDRAIYRTFLDNSVMITHNYDRSEVVRIMFQW